ncbi:MAG: fatty acid desaturase [Ferruginibacter sp.]
MAFLDVVLQPPSYGWKDASGNFSKPTPAMIFREFFSRLNIIKSRKNWLPFFSWLKVLCLAPFLFIFITQYFNGWLLLAGFIYGMILMGTHGTIWYHRYCTHGAFTFRNKWWKFFTQNLVLSVIPEEIYVISHHVHHAKSDEPGDPYFAEGGFLYCFLADVNHQPIAKDLSEKDYVQVKTLMKYSGVNGNNYNQYRRWGSFACPMKSVVQWILNWAFWIGVFYLIGGMGLVSALLAGVFIWAVGVRTFNYEGHGKGSDMRQEGTDHNRKDMSINQVWPGYVAGEWHNNHHLFPRSARSGFLPYQLDLAYLYVKLMYSLGAVTSYRDSRRQFYEQYYNPYLDKKKADSKVKKQSAIKIRL